MYLLSLFLILFGLLIGIAFLEIFYKLYNKVKQDPESCYLDEMFDVKFEIVIFILIVNGLVFAIGLMLFTEKIIKQILSLF